MGVTELSCGSHMLVLRQKADSRDRWAEIAKLKDPDRSARGAAEEDPEEREDSFGSGP